MITSELISKMTALDAERPRSTQTQVGPSEIGGCARRLWYRINKAEATNFSTLKLASIFGTAIHDYIEQAFAGDENYLTEVAVEKDDVMGHIDLIDLQNKVVWDWKTTTKSGMRYFPTEQQTDQIQLYGYLAKANGYDIEKVGIVAIPRDGNETNIVEHLFDYNEEIALEAINRLRWVKEQFEPPAPEASASFCKNYCQFYGLCEGK